jgi:hypothetical protein
MIDCQPAEQNFKIIELMNASILDFIKGQKVATVCCLDEKGFPYSFNCFYAFDSKEGLLHFKSSPSSDHSRFLSQKPQVAGTILPGRLNYLALKGIQFTGIVLDPADVLCQKAGNDYHKRFPFALAKSGEICTVQLESIKMTDNTKGFGTKIIWKREELELSQS